VSATPYPLPHGKLPTHFLTELLMIQQILEQIAEDELSFSPDWR
jgi:hypothetical protein